MFRAKKLNGQRKVRNYTVGETTSLAGSKTKKKIDLAV